MQCKDVHFDYEKQLDQFIERGLKIKDRAETIHCLKHLSYYKIKEFAHFFRQDNGIYKEGAYFQTILRNFYFDKNLRMEFLKCSEKIELSIKARICYILGAKYGAFGYLRFSTWCDRNLPKKILIREEENFKKKISKKMRVFSDNPLVKEFILENPQQEYLSIWRVGEILTFGEVLNLFKLMSHQNQILVVKNYNLSIKEFISYANCIKFMRNLCAHNMAIVTLKLKTIPRLHIDFKHIIADSQKIISPILIMVFLIRNIDPFYSFKDLYSTLENIDKNIDSYNIGILDLDALKIFLKVKEND